MGIGDWFRSQMFGGRTIVRTVGVVTGQPVSVVKVELKVHSLEESNPRRTRFIGLEIVSKSFLSYQMTPCTLSVDEGKQLIELLQNAVQ